MSRLSSQFYTQFRARICKRVRSPGIVSKESIPPAYVAWRASTTNRIIVPARQVAGKISSLESIPGLLKRLKIQALAAIWIKNDPLCTLSEPPPHHHISDEGNSCLLYREEFARPCLPWDVYYRRTSETPPSQLLWADNLPALLHISISFPPGIG
jgi:hypothetical protein